MLITAHISTLTLAADADASCRAMMPRCRRDAMIIYYAATLPARLIITLPPARFCRCAIDFFAAAAIDATP